MIISSFLDKAISASISEKSMLIFNRVHVIENGPTGKPEALCLIEASVACQGFWYGYVCQHPKKDRFVALIVYSNAFIDGGDTNTLFARFDYFMRIRLKYDPVLSDGFERNYSEALNFPSAIDALAELISSRTADRSYKGVDMRVADVFGFVDHKDRDGIYPECP